MEEDLKHRHVMLVPKGQSYTSIMLNGMGNGAMLAAIPAFVVTQTYKFAKGKPIHSKAELGATIFTALGGVYGAYHGIQEAKVTLAYRAEVAGKVNEMQQHVETQGNKIAELYKAVQAKEAHGKAR